MTLIRKYFILLVANGVIFASLYLAFAISIFAVSAILLKQGIVSPIPLIKDHQKLLYLSGFRRIWQVEPDCITFDEDLLYKPKVGECRFENTEFKSVLNFDGQGRISGGKTNRVGIAVLGDSFAMGWGVSDHETFSARLESMTGRPVFNLGVSSYGTYRELLRLEKSGLLGKIDTIIIQYCDNDISENEELSKLRRTYTPDQFDRLFSKEALSSHAIDASWLEEAIKAPARKLKRYFFPPPINIDDFQPHYKALNETLKHFPWTKDKRVIIFHFNRYPHLVSNFSEITSQSPRDDIEFVELELGPELSFALDGHWTAAGHEKVAALLVEALSKR